MVNKFSLAVEKDNRKEAGMTDSRFIRAKKNIVVSLMCQIVTVLCGLVIPKIMLDAFGSEIYGAIASISQFLAYITLLEGGIGGVARAVLYKPLAEDDKTKLSAIMSELQSFFRVLAGIFSIYVFILACSFRTISGLQELDQFTTALLVIVISVSTLGQYFIGISNSIFLQAAQRSYVTNLVNLGGTVVNTVVTVFLVMMHCDIITVKMVSSLIFLIKPFVLYVYVRKCYGINRISETKTNYLSQKWSGLGQHLAYFLHSNTDVVVLTCLASLKDVSVYSVYNMIVSQIQNFTISFLSGMEALFGDMLAKKEQELLHETFGIYETMISIVSIVLFSVVALLIIPFVKLYTVGVTDINYQEPVFALLLTISSLLYCLRMPYHSLVIAAGHFKQTNIAAYGEAVINVLISVTLVSRMGLVGVAIGTICGTGLRFLYYIAYLSKHIFYRKILETAKRAVVNIVNFIIILVLGNACVSQLSISNYGSWIVGGIISVFIAMTVTILLNYIFYREKIMSVLKQILKKEN